MINTNWFLPKSKDKGKHSLANGFAETKKNFVEGCPPSLKIFVRKSQFRCPCSLYTLEQLEFMLVGTLQVNAHLSFKNMKGLAAVEFNFKTMKTYW